MLPIVVSHESGMGKLPVEASVDGGACSDALPLVVLGTAASFEGAAPCCGDVAGGEEGAGEAKGGKYCDTVNAEASDEGITVPRVAV